MSGFKALVIGGSAGSLDVLLKMLPDLQTPLHIAIVIVVHRKQGMDSLLSDLLQARTSIKVMEIEEKMHILAGQIYVAPSDYHTLIEKDFTFSLDYSEKINYSRPSIDVTFQSAADAYQRSLSCLLLSGSNADGVNGLISASSFGAETVVQDPATAQVEYMPSQALQRAKIDLILSPDEMATYINHLSKNAHHE